MSEAQTEARDYFISSNPQYMQQSVSLDGSSIAALPQEWSSSRHGFHGETFLKCLYYDSYC
jgi:hypothetical protein